MCLNLFIECCLIKLQMLHIYFLFSSFFSFQNSTTTCFFLILHKKKITDLQCALRLLGPHSSYMHNMINMHYLNTTKILYLINPSSCESSIVQSKQMPSLDFPPQQSRQPWKQKIAWVKEGDQMARHINCGQKKHSRKQSHKKSCQIAIQQQNSHPAFTEECAVLLKGWVNDEGSHSVSVQSMPHTSFITFYGS